MYNVYTRINKFLKKKSCVNEKQVEEQQSPQKEAIVEKLNKLHITQDSQQLFQLWSETFEFGIMGS